MQHDESPLNELQYRRDEQVWLQHPPFPRDSERPDLPPGPFKRLVRNIVWGVGMGIGMASLLSLWVLFLSLLSGSEEFGGSGTTAWEIIRTYFAAALVVGSLVGLLRPITRCRAGAVTLGMVGGFLGYSAIGIAMDGWQNFQWWIAAGPGAFVGGGCAWNWTKPRDGRDADVV